MFLLSRTDIPVISLGIINDDDFTDVPQWWTIFRTAFRQAKSMGVPLEGKIYIAANMVERMFGVVVLETPIQVLTTLSLEFDSLEIYADQSLPDDTAILR